MDRRGGRGRPNGRASIGPAASYRLSKSVMSGGGGAPTAAGTATADDSLSVAAAVAGVNSGTSVGGFFPFKLTATLAALKIVGGCMLIGLGAAAIVQHAGYAGYAAGIWTGVVVVVCGVLGAYTVRTGALRVYVITFLAASLVSLLACVLLIIYSATGLAKDANMPYGVRTTPNGEVVVTTASDGGDSDNSGSDDSDSHYAYSIRSREAAMLINTLLIIIGFLDIIFSLPSIIICLRELCDCYDPRMFGTGGGGGGGGVMVPGGGKEWLMSWLGQQSHANVFYSQASGRGVPYGKLRSSAPLRAMYGPPPQPPPPPRHSPPFIHIPPDAASHLNLIPSHISDPSTHLTPVYPTATDAGRMMAPPPLLPGYPSDPSHSMPSSRHSPRDQQHQLTGSNAVHMQQTNTARRRTRSKSPNPRHAHSVRLSGPHHAHQAVPGPPPPPQGLPGGHHTAPPMAAYHPHFAATAPLEVFSPYFYPPAFHPAPVHHHQAHGGGGHTSHPSPGSNLSHPAFHHQIIGFPHGMMMGGGGMPPPWFYPPPTDWDPHYQEFSREERHQSRDQQREHQRKRSRSKSAAPAAADATGVTGVTGATGASGARAKTRRGPTDSDIERTYTGMDRELAEEFIDQTMDPRASNVDQTMSGTESEAW